MMPCMLLELEQGLHWLQLGLMGVINNLLGWWGKRRCLLHGTDVMFQSFFQR